MTPCSCPRCDNKDTTYIAVGKYCPKCKTVWTNDPVTGFAKHPLTNMIIRRD